MNPVPLDLTIWKGITFGPEVMTLHDGDDQPVDLTGWSVYAHVRHKLGGYVILDLAPQITDAAAGEITIEVDYTLPRTLQAGSYLWDLIVEPPTGVRLGPLFQGLVTIEETSTKPGEE